MVQLRIANESVYGTYLRMLSKMDLRVQIDAKSGQLKMKLRVNFLVCATGVAQESANGTTINAFKVVQFRVHLIIRLKFNLKLHF